jgi:hypothetical protein
MRDVERRGMVKDWRFSPVDNIRVLCTTRSCSGRRLWNDHRRVIAMADLGLEVHQLVLQVFHSVGQTLDINSEL